MEVQSFLNFSLLLLLFLCAAGQGQEEGDVRLVGGPRDYQGTVSVYHDGEWGSICDDSWGYADADVVCKMLGFERSRRLYYRAYFGRLGEDTPVWIDEINCPRGAQSILECGSSGWGVHDCSHNEDAGVECLRKFPRKPAEMEVRLLCPHCTQWGSCNTCPRKTQPSPTDCTPQATVEGVVFANYKGQWSPVTGEGWDLRDATVVCGELGYPLALPGLNGNIVPTLNELWTNWDGQFLDQCDKDGGQGLLMGPSYPRCNLDGDEGPGSGTLDGLCTAEEIEENRVFRESLKRVLLKKVYCTGQERRLLDCYFPEFGPEDNPSLKVATVRCGFQPHRDCPQQSNTETYRLRGSAVPWQGRVEVRVGGHWGTICDTDYDIIEANIICRALGYGTASHPHYRAFYGRGVGTIHYANLRCSGNERTLGDCTKKSTGRTAQSCGHYGDAGVMCNIPQPCLDPEVKLARLLPVPLPNYPAYSDNYIQVRGAQGWGILCRDSLDLKAATVICRAELQEFAFRLRSGTLQGNVTRYTGVLQCNGNEDSVHDCTLGFVRTPSCAGSGGGDAVVDCSSGLPDLVPDLETLERSLSRYPYIYILPLYYLRCAREENCLSSSAEGQGPNDLRSLLRFDSLTMNWGTTDFLPDRRRDQWQFHSCHNHFHSFEAFIHYDLLDFATGTKVAEGHKASFCLEDSSCSIGGGARYSCASGIQGISPNCGDLYGSHLDCQWIDITGVPQGLYRLQLIVNPDGFVAESDRANNNLTCVIELQPPYTFRSNGCSLSDH